LRDPFSYFRARGEHMAGMSPEAQIDALNEAARPAREMTGIPGVVRAGEAVGEAASDPSIPNAAKAGAATGAALFRPGIVAGSLGAGYAGAVAKDLGLFDPSSASAAELTARQRRALEIEKQRSEQASKIKEQELDAEAARSLKTQAASKDREAFDRQMSAADARLQEDLARAKRGRFEDSNTKKVYDATAGYTPALVPFAQGAAIRAIGGDSKGTKLAAILGGVPEGVIGANLPLGWDAYIGPPSYNPTREAYEDYVRDIPSKDPTGAPTRRAEMQEYIDKYLPKANPIRERAGAEFFDPQRLAERSGVGAVEGGAGGGLGHLFASLFAKGGAALAAPFRGRGGPALPSGGPAGPSNGGSPIGTLGNAGTGGPSPITLVPERTPQPLIEKMRAGQDVVPPEGQLPETEASANQLVRTLGQFPIPANRNARPRPSPEVDSSGNQKHRDPETGRYTSPPEE
jgi:hypothetical protein